MSNIVIVWEISGNCQHTNNAISLFNEQPASRHILMSGQVVHTLNHQAQVECGFCGARGYIQTDGDIEVSMKNGLPQITRNSIL